MITGPMDYGMPKKNPGKADPALLDGRGHRIVVCVARFNSEITYAMRDLCVNRLVELGVSRSDIVVTEVPGSFELPMIAMRRLQGTNVQAAIAIGAVIRGETDHYKYIARSVADGLQRVAIECKKPVIFGVLTTDTVRQARARIKQARDYADNAVEMINTALLNRVF